MRTPLLMWEFDTERPPKRHVYSLEILCEGRRYSLGDAGAPIV